MKRLASLTAVALATITGVLVLWEFRTALGLFILSLILAAVLRPIVDRLCSMGLARSLALAFTYLAIVALMVVLLLALGGPFINEIQTILHDLPASFDLLRTQWLNGSLLQQTIARNFQDLNSLFQTVAGDQGNIVLQNFLSITLGSVDLVSKIMIVIVVSIYWSADQEHFMRLWLSLLPPEWRTRSRDIIQNIELEIGAYLRSELIQSLLTVIILGIGYQLIGVRYPISVALIGAIGWLLVWIGGLAAVIPALLAGLAVNPVTGLAAALFTIVVLAFMEFVVEPRLFNRQRTSSLLVVIMVLIMVQQLGMAGFLVATPLAAAIQIIARHLIHPKPDTIELKPPPNVQIETLKERLASIQAMMAERAEPASPEINNLVSRLDELIERADQAEI